MTNKLFVLNDAENDDVDPEWVYQPNTSFTVQDCRSCGGKYAVMKTTVENGDLSVTDYGEFQTRKAAFEKVIQLA